MDYPVYMHEADLDDPEQFAVWALCQWPGVEKSQPYPPAAPPLLPFHSAFLHQLGFRLHPELAVLKKVPGSDGKPVFIGVDEPDPVVDVEAQAESDEALRLLAMLSPEAAERIEAMTDDERREMLGVHYEDYVQSVEVLKNMKSLFGME